MERLLNQINFILEIDKTKNVLRNTILMDSSRKENDAEHSWHMAVAAIILSEYCNTKKLNMLKIIKMILIHDIVEIDSGDTFAYEDADRAEVAQRENAAANRIFGLLPIDQRNEYFELWQEFESGATDEVKYARALDTFMPILHNYYTKGSQWQLKGVASKKVIERSQVIKLGSEVLYKYMENLIKDARSKGYLND